MKRRILFVDDEPRILEGLGRMLRPLRQEWDMEFVTSGALALDALARTPFDVLVSDMRMPNMDGMQLLTEVRGRYPQVVRLILSGQCSRETMLRAVRVAHRQLTKPCQPDVLRAVVTRACALRDVLTDRTLLTLTSRLESVPSLPALYQEVMRELEAPEPSLQKVGEIISADAGMAAKILQVVHSAIFGIRFRVSSPAQAVMLLGLETCRALVLAISLFSKLNPDLLKTFSLESLWSHSQATSGLARRLAMAEQCDQRVIEEACMAGLLLDIGKLVLAGYLPDSYREVLTLVEREQLSCTEAERSVFGATHAEVGGHLLSLWGLPEGIVEAVAWHHRPGECPMDSFGPLTAVHVADSLLGTPQDGVGGNAAAMVDMAYLERLGLSHRLPAWCELAQQPD
jgi:HD-like signal output (HDOD) protein